MQQSDDIYYYIGYAMILAVFFIILKLPKKSQGNKSEKKNISTSKKFNKDLKDQQNEIKDI
jgi:hypothetical protein